MIITTARKRVTDVHSQDVVMLRIDRTSPAWRFVYEAMSGDEFDRAEYSESHIAELVQAAGNPDDFDERDVILRVAMDDDRTEGPGVNQDAWVRFRNPYELIEFQIEVKDANDT